MEMELIALIVVVMVLAVLAKVVGYVYDWAGWNEKSRRRTSSDYGIQLGTESAKTRSRLNYLELHGCTKIVAMARLEKFLQRSVMGYRNGSYNSYRFVHVITGWGRHSTGDPVIKPAVESYLRNHSYTYEWDNEGMVTIDLKLFRRWY